MIAEWAGPVTDDALVGEQDPERIAILRAINRLLVGDVARKLTVKDLAAEAGVHRDVLYRKHADLRQVWKQELENSGTATEPPVIVRLREHLESAKALSASRGRRIEQLEGRLRLYAENLAVAVARVNQLETDYNVAPRDDGIPRLRVVAESGCPRCSGGG